MHQDRTPPGEFRKRIKNRQHMLGTFIKIPTSHTIEIVGLAGFDFAAIDQEHGAFDRSAVPYEGDLRRAAEVLNAGKRVAILVGAGALAASG